MPTKPHRGSRGLSTLSGTIVVCASLIALAGCGGAASSSTSSRAAAATQVASPTPTQSGTDVGSVQAQDSTGKHASRARGDNAARPAPEGVSAVGRTVKLHNARPNQTPELDQTTQVSAKPINPCTLVTRSEAASIIGRSVAASEAPLGPTCIYRLIGSKNEITLAIEAMSFSQVAHQLTKRTKVTVGSRQAYCGSLGTRMLLVPLAGGRVLHVSAPCAQAQRFAALALSHLTA